MQIYFEEKKNISSVISVFKFMSYIYLFIEIMYLMKYERVEKTRV